MNFLRLPEELLLLILSYLPFLQLMSVKKVSRGMYNFIEENCHKLQRLFVTSLEIKDILNGERSGNYFVIMKLVENIEQTEKSFSYSAEIDSLERLEDHMKYFNLNYIKKIKIKVKRPYNLFGILNNHIKKYSFLEDLILSIDGTNDFDDFAVFLEKCNKISFMMLDGFSQINFPEDYIVPTFPFLRDLRLRNKLENINFGDKLLKSVSETSPMLGCVSACFDSKLNLIAFLNSIGGVRWNSNECGNPCTPKNFELFVHVNNNNTYHNNYGFRGYSEALIRTVMRITNRRALSFRNVNEANIFCVRVCINCFTRKCFSYVGIPHEVLTAIDKYGLLNRLTRENLITRQRLF
uniref:F-box domain-containing protein n=1 Tax=Parastrongyloides trichosuri TaxID=131310 RepID=A0A0N4Z7X5_PARTI